MGGEEAEECEVEEAEELEEAEQQLQVVGEGGAVEDVKVEELEVISG